MKDAGETTPIASRPRHRAVLESHQPAETRAMAARLARRLAGDERIALSGPLGSGKTCFVQGLARGLGVRRAVNSPSFVLMKRYAGTVALYHWDWYRLRDRADLDSSGFGDPLVERGVVVIEWADRFPGELAQPYLSIDIAPTGPHSRRLALQVCGRSAALRRLLGDIQDWWTEWSKTDAGRRHSGH
jgi:tRNA threonylcarbamoyladenosine biosynthesis protein TsaE